MKRHFTIKDGTVIELAEMPKAELGYKLRGACVSPEVDDRTGLFFWPAAGTCTERMSVETALACRAVWHHVHPLSTNRWSYRGCDTVRPVVAEHAPIEQMTILAALRFAEVELEDFLSFVDEQYLPDSPVLRTADEIGALAERYNCEEAT